MPGRGRYDRVMQLLTVAAILTLRARPAGLGAGALPVLAWTIGLALLVRSRRRILRAGP